MTPMPIPMEPMDSIPLDVFRYSSTSHDGEVYDQLLLCVCRLSGYLIVIPIPSSCRTASLSRALGPCPRTK